jgi:hypothetical protein
VVDRWCMDENEKREAVVRRPKFKKKKKKKKTNLSWPKKRKIENFSWEHWNRVVI